MHKRGHVSAILLLRTQPDCMVQKRDLRDCYTRLVSEQPIALQAHLPLLHHLLHIPSLRSQKLAVVYVDWELWRQSELSATWQIESSMRLHSLAQPVWHIMREYECSPNRHHVAGCAIGDNAIRASAEDDADAQIPYAGGLQAELLGQSYTRGDRSTTREGRLAAEPRLREERRSGFLFKCDGVSLMPLSIQVSLLSSASRSEYKLPSYQKPTETHLRRSSMQLRTSRIRRLQGSFSKSSASLRTRYTSISRRTRWPARV